VDSERLQVHVPTRGVRGWISKSLRT